MQYSSNYLTNLGCYGIGYNIYENWVMTCGFQPIDYQIVVKNYKNNLQEHKRLIKKFPHFIEIHSMFDFSNIYIYKKLYKLYGLPQGECIHIDITNNSCNPIFNKTINSPMGNSNPTIISIPHSHIGNWTHMFLDCDDFDRGFERIYFINKSMLQLFLTNIILSDKNSYNILD